MPRRYKHDEPSCSSGKDACLTITRTLQGWQYYCHRCGEGGTIRLTGLSTRQAAAFARSNKPSPGVTGAVRGTVRLPADFTQQIPAPGLAWLYKSGITQAEIRTFMIGYSPSQDRVILPVYDRDQRLIYWQGRYLGDHKRAKARKYTNQYQLGREMTYFCNEGHPVAGGVVLVEDILSAIKVGRVTNAVALLFATIPRKLVQSLVERGYQTIYIWLDPDKAEYTARQLMRLRSFNYPVRRVYSPRDPKCYNEVAIREFLNIKEVVK